MIEKVYKFVAGDKINYLVGNKIYTSASQLTEETLPQLEEPLPEIECDEYLADGGVGEVWQIIHGKDISVSHSNFLLKEEGEEDGRIKEQSVERSRPIRVAKHREKSPRRDAKPKRISVRKP